MFLNHLEHLKAFVANKSVCKAHALRSKRGGEYPSKDFSKNGIEHNLTVLYSPIQNGVSECVNRNLLELVRSDLHSKSLAKKFWNEALNNDVYVHNCVTSRVFRDGNTPHHLWFGRPPIPSHLRVFGCQTLYTLLQANVQKLDEKARKAIFLVYSDQSKGYMRMDTKTKQSFVSRNVVFDELSNVSTDSGEIDVVTLSDSEPEETLSNTDTPAPDFSEIQKQDSDADVNHAQNYGIAAESNAPQSTSEAQPAIPDAMSRR